MQVLIAISILLVFIVLYVVAFVSNSKVDKPKDCKDISCSVCGLNCSKKERSK